MLLGYFRNTKSQRNFISTLAVYASHEARRRMAVFSVQLAVYHTRPASRGTRRATAVTPQPTRISLECPAPYGRGVGCRGSPPAASHEARCRMAAFPVQLAVYHTRPASRGTCRATAVTPQPTRISLECPTPYGRGVGCRGSPPAASHEARRRMAVFPVQLAVYHARPASRGTRRATAVKPRPTVMSPYAPARLRRAVRGAGALPLPRRRAWSGRIGRRFEGWGR